MTRIGRARRLLTGLTLLLLLAGAPAWGATPAGGPVPLPKGWGRLLASGTLTAVDRAHGAVTLAVARTGKVDTFEGGGAWRETALAGAHLIHLLPQTLTLDAGAHAIPVAAIRPGERAMVWAVVQPNGAIVALTVEITSPRLPASPVGPADGSSGTVGVVIRRSGMTIEMLAGTGSRRTVVMTAGTVLRSGGKPVPAAAIGPYDVLRVDGPVNSDGSLVATRIDVEIAAASAAQVSGPITEGLNGVGGLVVAETMICTTADTYAIRDAARTPLTRVAPGRPVVVYGAWIMDGNTPVCLSARVVVVH